MTNDVNKPIFSNNVFPWPKDEFQRWGMALARNYALERTTDAEVRKAEEPGEQNLPLQPGEPANEGLH